MQSANFFSSAQGLKRTQQRAVSVSNAHSEPVLGKPAALAVAEPVSLCLGTPFTMWALISLLSLPFVFDS